MASRHFAVSAKLSAPAANAYATIADYKNGHPRILPKPAFESIVVERGGVGAGTAILATMRVMGSRQSFRALISEPDPGRVLKETTNTGFVTTFTVEPQDSGQAEVTIATEMTLPGGFTGRIQGWMMERVLKPIYTKELKLLEQEARAQVRRTK